MILTASSVSDLSNALSWWERGEYLFSFVVAVACFGEYVADFMPKWYRTGDTERDEKRKESLAKISTLVLVAALVFELVCVVRSNSLAGEVIGSINGLATDAAGQAKTALDNAGKAQTLAQSASDTAKPAKATADEAKVEADQAGSSAATALTMAGNARRKADSFEAKITSAENNAASAETKAADAESHLADALQRAADAEIRAANTERKIADRHISPAQQERIRNSLAKWNGMDIRLPITMVNGDDETWTYAGELLSTLCAIPGWSAELDSVSNNSGASNLAVTVPEDAPTPDKSLADDLMTALHDAGIEAKGPVPPPLAGGMGGGRFRACGKLNPQHPTVDDPSHPFNVKVEIQISKRL